MNTTKRIVTEKRGSWKWQDAFRLATYIVVKAKTGKYIWRAIDRSEKFAHTKTTRCLWETYKTGSLHNKPAVLACIDDFGNMIFGG